MTTPEHYALALPGPADAPAAGYGAAGTGWTRIREGPGTRASQSTGIGATLPPPPLTTPSRHTIAGVSSATGSALPGSITCEGQGFGTGERSVNHGFSYPVLFRMPSRTFAARGTPYMYLPRGRPLYWGSARVVLG